MFRIIWFKATLYQFSAESLILAICNQRISDKTAVLVGLAVKT
jgi:hypothetical protein